MFLFAQEHTCCVNYRSCLPGDRFATQLLTLSCGTFPSPTQDGLGPGLFVAWAAWVCVWTSAMLLALAVTNMCDYVHVFTRFSCETFGMLIAMLFMQQAVKGTMREFSLPEGADSLTRLVNGIWGLILALGLLLTATLSRSARKWRFLNGFCRAAIEDYGAALAVLVWTGVSYALSGVEQLPSSVPTRVACPDTPDALANTSSVANQMADVPGEFIAGALVPALVITLLFYFVCTRNVYFRNFYSALLCRWSFSMCARLCGASALLCSAKLDRIVLDYALGHVS